MSDVNQLDSPVTQGFLTDPMSHKTMESTSPTVRNDSNIHGEGKELCQEANEMAAATRIQAVARGAHVRRQSKQVTANNMTNEKKTNENAKNANENAKNANENEKNTNENAKNPNENEKGTNENAKDTNENENGTNENEKDTNENEYTANEANKTIEEENQIRPDEASGEVSGENISSASADACPTKQVKSTNLQSNSHQDDTNNQEQSNHESMDVSTVANNVEDQRAQNTDLNDHKETNLQSNDSSQSDETHCIEHNGDEEGTKPNISSENNTRVNAGPQNSTMAENEHDQRKGNDTASNEETMIFSQPPDRQEQSGHHTETADNSNRSGQTFPSQNDSTKVQSDEAAIQIQAAFRGYSVRQNSDALATDASPVQASHQTSGQVSSNEAHDAATRIQSVVRGRQTRKVNKTVPNSAKADSTQQRRQDPISFLFDKESEIHNLFIELSRGQEKGSSNNTISDNGRDVYLDDVLEAIERLGETHGYYNLSEFVPRADLHRESQDDGLSIVNWNEYQTAILTAYNAAKSVQAKVQVNNEKGTHENESSTGTTQETNEVQKSESSVNTTDSYNHNSPSNDTNVNFASKEDEIVETSQESSSVNGNIVDENVRAKTSNQEKFSADEEHSNSKEGDEFNDDTTKTNENVPISLEVTAELNKISTDTSCDASKPQATTHETFELPTTTMINCDETTPTSTSPRIETEKENEASNKDKDGLVTDNKHYAADEETINKVATDNETIRHEATDKEINIYQPPTTSSNVSETTTQSNNMQIHEDQDHTKSHIVGDSHASSDNMSVPFTQEENHQNAHQTTDSRMADTTNTQLLENEIQRQQRILELQQELERLQTLSISQPITKSTNNNAQSATTDKIGNLSKNDTITTQTDAIEQADAIEQTDTIMERIDHVQPQEHLNRPVRQFSAPNHIPATGNTARSYQKEYMNPQDQYTGPLQLSAVLRKNKRIFDSVFRFYAHSQRKASISRATFDSIATFDERLSKGEFLRCCTDFGLIPLLIRRHAAVRIFQDIASTVRSSHVTRAQFPHVLAEVMVRALHRLVAMDPKQQVMIQQKRAGWAPLLPDDTLAQVIQSMSNGEKIAVMLQVIQIDDPVRVHRKLQTIATGTTARAAVSFDTGKGGFYYVRSPEQTSLDTIHPHQSDRYAAYGGLRMQVRAALHSSSYSTMERKSAAQNPRRVAQFSPMKTRVNSLSDSVSSETLQDSFRYPPTAVEAMSKHDMSHSFDTISTTHPPASPVNAGPVLSKADEVARRTQMQKRVLAVIMERMNVSPASITEREQDFLFGPRVQSADSTVTSIAGSEDIETYAQRCVETSDTDEMFSSIIRQRREDRRNKNMRRREKLFTRLQQERIRSPQHTYGQLKQNISNKSIDNYHPPTTQNSHHPSLHQEATKSSPQFQNQLNTHDHVPSETFITSSLDRSTYQSPHLSEPVSTESATTTKHFSPSENQYKNDNDESQVVSTSRNINSKSTSRSKILWSSEMRKPMTPGGAAAASSKKRFTLSPVKLPRSHSSQSMKKPNYAQPQHTFSGGRKSFSTSYGDNRLEDFDRHRATVQSQQNLASAKSLSQSRSSTHVQQYTQDESDIQTQLPQMLQHSSPGKRATEKYKKRAEEVMRYQPE